MKLDIYQVDAFSQHPFGGNPAAVCPLTEWLPDEQLQNIAAENNLSETAYFVPRGDFYELRWFTPEVEVDLCGHATLAAAWVLIHQLADAPDVLRFATRLAARSAGAVWPGNPSPVRRHCASREARRCGWQSARRAVHPPIDESAPRLRPAWHGHTGPLRPPG